MPGLQRAAWAGNVEKFIFGALDLFQTSFETLKHCNRRDSSASTGFLCHGPDARAFLEGRRERL
jgi:hypothetical protein